MAKKDTSGIFDSVLVHFGPEKARFHPTHLKISRSFLTVPSAWQFKPLTEVSLTVEVPRSKKSKAKKEIKCRGIIIDCKPLHKKKQTKDLHYQVDLLLADVPTKHSETIKKLIPHLGP
jgi:hypothetical protein